MIKEGDFVPHLFDPEKKLLKFLLKSFSYSILFIPLSGSQCATKKTR